MTHHKHTWPPVARHACLDVISRGCEQLCETHSAMAQTCLLTRLQQAVQLKCHFRHLHKEAGGSCDFRRYDTLTSTCAIYYDFCDPLEGYAPAITRSVPEG